MKTQQEGKALEESFDLFFNTLQQEYERRLKELKYKIGENGFIKREGCDRCPDTGRFKSWQ